MAMIKRILPAPPPPPEGFMLWHQRLIPVSKVERHCASIMAGFDDLPRRTRFALNAAPAWPHQAGVEVARRGDEGAAQSIINHNWSLIFKTRDRKGVHP